MDLRRTGSRHEQFIGCADRKIGVDVGRKIQNGGVVRKLAIEPCQERYCRAGVVERHGAAHARPTDTALQRGIGDLAENPSQLRQRFLAMSSLGERSEMLDGEGWLGGCLRYQAGT